MTKETHEPLLADDESSNKSVRPTVFSDGSTFDYVNGYRSNGAPAATRDREKVPTIAKAGAIMSVNSLANLIIALVLLAILAVVAWTGMTSYHEQANERAIVSTINISGQAEVVGGKILTENGNSVVVLRDNNDRNIYRCDVYTVVDTTAKALVFCNEGPVNFTIPVPYDPANLFYTTPAQDH